MKAGFRPAGTHYPTYYRNNERRVTDDPRLAADLFRRMRSHAPETIMTKDDRGDGRETWRIHSLNERLRFCRYLPGQFFGRHLDGIHHRARDARSLLTFMIYLNDASEFRGGRTLFYESKTSSTILAEYHPRAGDLIIFDHGLWHEGERVDAGEKYILRSDILYERMLSDEDRDAKGESATATPFTPGHLGYIWKIVRMTDGNFITAGRDREIKIWDSRGRPLEQLRGHGHSILALEELDQGDFASGSRDGTIKFWKRESPGNYRLARTTAHHKGTVLSLRCMGPDAAGNQHLASSGSDGTVIIQSIEGDLLYRLEGHRDWVWDLAALSPNHLISISQDARLGVWDLRRRRCIRFLEDAGAPLNALAINRGEAREADSIAAKRIFAGDGRGHVHAWSFGPDDKGGSGEGDYAFVYRGGFNAHEGVVRTLIPLGDWGLASGGEDNRVRVWNHDGRLLAEYRRGDFTQSLVFDGERGILYSAGYDGIIQAVTPPPVREYP